MGKLNLEAHPDSVVPLLTGDVQDEPAGESQERGGGARATSLFTHADSNTGHAIG